MKTFDGKNISIENGDLVTAIRNLKSKVGKDMIVYGGAGFVLSLIKEGLIDSSTPLSTQCNKGLRIFDFA